MPVRRDARQSGPSPLIIARAAKNKNKTTRKDDTDAAAVAARAPAVLASRERFASP